MFRSLLVSAAVVAAALAGVGITSASSSAAPTWAPAATATFVYSDGSATYIGYAAHCAGLGAATDTNGCLAGTLPVGTPVEIDGASRPGTLAYSSWATMQAVGETDENTCAYNDLALVRIDPADVANVNPSIPHWGG